MTTSTDTFGQGHDPSTYDATEGEESTWGALRYIALLVVLAAFGGFVYLAYMQGVRNGSMGVPPLVAANETPFKTAPSDPGGRTIPNTDKSIYDRVNPPGVTSEGLAAAPETPSEIVTAQSDSQFDNMPLITAETEAAPILPTPRPDGITAAIDAAETDMAQGGPTFAPEEAPREELVDIAAATPAPVKTPTPSTASVAGGGYVVQIAAFRDRPSAEAAWNALSAKSGDLLGGLGADYQTADVPGKGTYTRLRVAPFADKSAADALCGALKARGQDCIVKKS